ncbi:MAG: histidinol-phosphate transaminase, partial [Gammaproteobacteria bacterium]
SAAVEAFQDQDYFEQTCQKIIASREWVTSELIALGFEVLPSAANFILVKHPQHDAADLAADLRKQGIIVRHFKQNRISQFLRITIGTTEENQQLLAVLDTLVD